MFKKGQLIRSNSTGFVYLVNTWPSVTLLIQKTNQVLARNMPRRPRKDFELIGNNYKAK